MEPRTITPDASQLIEALYRTCAIIDRAGQLTDAEVVALDDLSALTPEYPEARRTAWFAARDAGRSSAWISARNMALAATRRSAASGTNAVLDAVLATLTHDLIDDVTYRMLTRPWLSVIGDPHDNK